MSATISFPTTVVAAPAPHGPLLDRGPSVTEQLVQAGRRGAPRALVMPVLQAWWTLLAVASIEDRAVICDDLRHRVRAGDTTARAWLPIALGETDPALVRAAVLGYVGATPVSIERRASAVHDAVDWIRRGLALNRTAVFEALLGLGDEATLEALARARSALPAGDARRLCDAWANAEEECVAEFVEDWRTRLA